MTELLQLSADDVRRLVPDALRRPAQEGARLTALLWLHQLAEARREWQQFVAPATADELPAQQDAAGANQSDTLHRARVALRRLRATVREHDRVLEDVFDGRTARALRALGKATNAARDADVQRAWLDAEMEQLPADAQREALQLRARLTPRHGVGPSEVEASFAEHFDPIAESLFARLGTFRMLQRVGIDTTPMPFARQLATRVGRVALRLRRDIERVTDVSSQDAMHRARIRLKRQRAILAPFARSRPAVGAWFDLATRGQDLLGTLRDAHLLAHRARKAKLPALAKALQDSVLAHYAAFSHDWCERLDEMTAVIDTAAAALRSEGTPVTTGGVTMEIERKFLLRGCPPAARAVAPVRIEQGWLPGTALRERLRRRIAPDGTVSCLRTVKLGPAAARIEVEELTPPELFDAMWPLTRMARVRKERHIVADGAHTWEIDVFLDRSLVLAEVELGDVGEKVTVPTWLAPYVEREVTGEPAYFNSSLARADH